MIIDRELTVSLAQVVTASAASTDYYDQGAARDFGAMEGMSLVVTVDEAATAAGAATVTITLECDDNIAFSSPKTVATSAAIGKAVLVPGYRAILPIPADLNERYFRAYYTVATGPLTAGKFTATVVNKLDSAKHYPDAL